MSLGLKTSGNINKQIMIKGENQSPQPRGRERRGVMGDAEGLTFLSDSEVHGGAGTELGVCFGRRRV